MSPDVNIAVLLFRALIFFACIEQSQTQALVCDLVRAILIKWTALSLLSSSCVA